ncbi:Uncharacterized protein FKW44_022160, partial [Caligus rogercresseyi]
EVIEFFNYPKSTVYYQWKAWNSFKKNDAHRKKRSRSLGATRTDEFVAEVKRKVNEDGNKWASQADHRPGDNGILMSSPAGLGSRPKNLPYHWSPDLWPPSSPDCNPLDYFFFWDMVENKTNKHAHNTLDSLRAAIVEEFANMKHRLEMVVSDGGYIEK